MTPHQIQALKDYFYLLNTYKKELFSERLRRLIILDRVRLEQFIEETGTTIGLVSENDFIYYVVDLVEARNPDGSIARNSDGSVVEYPYLRVISKRQLEGGENVAIIATIDNANLGPVGGIVLVEQERHSTGEFHLELPRGFGEPGLPGQQNALDELRKETGFVGDVANFMGETFTDTGLVDARVSFYHVPVSGRKAPNPEKGEAIKGIVIRSKEDVSECIRIGDIKDAFTVQAFMLLGIASRAS
ncbi:NUDIX hydrolase [Streptomyces sp. NBC_00151]|uniref:NUDIX hydrolase n=1 Tax=Streptomyces sp. NBC_00151 TaxID=2975669 RepID=UPI002DD82918|nr:NUDIX hydrolase [Streptomyces sp. NBC_00151]WRZ40686.1 NUDIX hydrolase [Streptomyces sp. NBC_00151]